MKTTSDLSHALQATVRSREEIEKGGSGADEAIVFFVTRQDDRLALGFHAQAYHVKWAVEVTCLVLRHLLTSSPILMGGRRPTR